MQVDHSVESVIIATPWHSLELLLENSPFLAKMCSGIFNCCNARILWSSVGMFWLRMAQDYSRAIARVIVAQLAQGAGFERLQV